jgi:hypothetical protein
LKAIARKSPTGRWRKRAQWAQRKLEALPAAMWVIMISIAALAVFSVTNVVYQVLRKPTEVFTPCCGSTPPRIVSQQSGLKPAASAEGKKMFLSLPKGLSACRAQDDALQ